MYKREVSKKAIHEQKASFSTKKTCKIATNCPRDMKLSLKYFPRIYLIVMKDVPRMLFRVQMTSHLENRPKMMR